MKATEKKLTNAVDEIGSLRASISDLQAELKILETQVKDSGYGVIEGELYRASIYFTERKVVKWKAIATKLGASNQMIAGNTKISESQGLRVSARLKAVA